MKRQRFLRLLAKVFALATAALLFGCGGGGGGGASIILTSVEGVIGGTGFKGPVSGATVTAYAIANGQMGAQIGTATTHVDGSFSMNIGNYAGSAMLQMSGGTYTDEATGSTMPLGSGDVITAMMTGITANSTVSGIQLTPLTGMAQKMAQGMTGGMTDANIAAANTAVGNYFMIGDILRTAPMNPLVSGSGGSVTQDMKNYGMVLAAMSQYAQAQGMTTSSAMVTAMMNDASDGVMNGKMGSSSVVMGGGMMGSSASMPANAGTSGLATAMTTFMASAQNKSGVTSGAMQTLMNQLTNSNGQIIGSGQPTQAGMIGGSGVKGPVSGATVTAYAIASATMGPQIGTATTDASGGFTMPIGTYAGSVMLKLMGGSFLDEATGTTMPMADGDVMTAVMTGVTAGSSLSGLQITPLTSMAQKMAQGMTGGMTDANIAAANSAMGRYFSVDDILHTMPMNPLVAGSGTGVTTSMQNYGMALAAMSQYARNLGMTSSSAMVTSMMNDAADGVLNGMNGTSQITMGGGGMGSGMGGGTMMSATAGSSGMADAMKTFINSSANKSGLTTTHMQALMTQLMGANGAMHP